jgi:hypothetical protein
MRHEEHNIQVNFVKWFRIKYKKNLIFSIPNGGKRGILEAVRLKKEGVVAGIPDIQVLLNNVSLFIELKTRTGKLSVKQKETISLMESLDHNIIVCYGFDDAVKKTVIAMDKIKEKLNNAR